MKILFASPEVAPFIKTGGLADVAGSLPQALAKEGHEVKVILPLYEGIGQEWRSQMTFLKYFNVTLSWRQVYCGVFELERDGVTYWFVDNEYYFKRWQLYGHFDDCERFAYFSRAVIETPGQLDFWPDVIHCNDWQTALVPIYLLEEKYRIPQLGRAKSVFTIHNIEYQGRFGSDTVDQLFGLDRGWYNDGTLQMDGDVNLMKGAMLMADAVTTVSPTYAAQLHDPAYAEGMASVVDMVGWKMHGVVNGIDTDSYDPAADLALPSHYDANHMAGKAACKAALQEELGLACEADTPLIAMVTRLVGHKGLDLVQEAMDGIMATGCQFVVLGTGEWRYEDFFRQKSWQYGGRLSAQLTYSEGLSRRIYAAADLFLMPSRSEPCGLSQMIAMRYGAVPIVRRTGGLADTVRSCQVGQADGTGYLFERYDAGAMLDVIGQATGLYRGDRSGFNAVRYRGMTADFTWDKSAGAYRQIYANLLG